MTVEALYHARLLDHYRNPRNKGRYDAATVVVSGANMSCGDRITLYLTCLDDVITRVQYDGDGCALSQAGASMLTELLVGMDVALARARKPEDMYKLLGVAVSAGRERCALLAHDALVRGLQDTSRA